MGGGGNINTINNFEEFYVAQTLTWLNKQKNEAIKTAVKEWPDDYRFISKLAYWFEQVTDAVNKNPPKDNVSCIVVMENMLSVVIDVDYEYYQQDDPDIGKMGFHIRVIRDI